MRDEYTSKENVTHNYVTTAMQEILDIIEYLEKNAFQNISQIILYQILSKKGELSE